MLFMLCLLVVFHVRTSIQVSFLLIFPSDVDKKFVFDAKHVKLNDETYILT